MNNDCVNIISYSKWQGDSGGPFTFKQGDQHILIGVITSATGQGESRPKPGSFGGQIIKNKCGGKTGFAKVSGVRDWIDKILSGATICDQGVNAG